MTVSQRIKKSGLSSLLEVSRMTNKAPNTITRWFADNTELFEIVLMGCVAKKSGMKMDFES